MMPRDQRRGAPRALRAAPAGLVIAALALLACEPKKPSDAGGSAAECASVRALGARSLKRWSDLNEAAPAPEAALGAIADHSAALGKAAREIGADFAKSAPRRADLAESAEGARMLGDLAGKRLDDVARTLHELGNRVPALEKLENAANEASVSLGRDVAASVGCEKTSAACAPVIDRMAEVDQPKSPVGFAAAALVSRERADTFDALAKAVEALPAAPPKQKAREEVTRHARESAAAFRALAAALDDATPFESRLGKERRDAQEASSRFASELTAASSICLPPSAASASAAPPVSAAPAAPRGSAR